MRTKNAGDFTYYPAIIIFEEKHGKQYFYVTNNEDFKKVALKVLKERLDSGYYYYEPEPPPPPDVTQEIVETLGKGPVRDLAVATLKRHERDLKYYEDDVSVWKLIQKAIADSDGTLALKALRSRNSHEYEGMNIERPQEY